MNNEIKLNVGASPIWTSNGWYILDHKKTSQKNSILGDASKIDLDDNSVSIIFCSHVVEHIPQIRIEDVFKEFNRVLKPGGVLRILTPDMEKILKAYASDDDEFFDMALQEDPNLRTDLGRGGIIANWFNSPGQDTVLLNRNLTEFITGVAHQYLYDFRMLEILLMNNGFNEISKNKFQESTIEELTIPLHVEGHKPEWNNLNQKFYKENNLIHQFNQASGKYEINFKLTGFDRDPLTSLIVECKKERTTDKNIKFTNSFNNYNRYGLSLLKDKDITDKLDKMNIKYPKQ